MDISCLLVIVENGRVMPHCYLASWGRRFLGPSLTPGIVAIFPSGMEAWNEEEKGV